MQQFWLILNMSNSDYTQIKAYTEKETKQSMSLSFQGGTTLWENMLEISVVKLSEKFFYSF